MQTIPYHNVDTMINLTPKQNQSNKFHLVFRTFGLQHTSQNTFDIMEKCGTPLIWAPQSFKLQNALEQLVLKLSKA